MPMRLSMVADLMWRWRKKITSPKCKKGRSSTTFLSYANFPKPSVIKKSASETMAFSASGPVT